MAASKSTFVIRCLSEDDVNEAEDDDTPAALKAEELDEGDDTCFFL
jgi:hypothetical protein